MGGGTMVKPHVGDLGAGLSPRGRGNRRYRSRRFDYIRSIPAWAGEPGLKAITAELDPVYPRVGGGTETTLSLTRAAKTSGRFASFRTPPDRSKRITGSVRMFNIVFFLRLLWAESKGGRSSL